MKRTAYALLLLMSLSTTLVSVSMAQTADGYRRFLLSYETRRAIWTDSGELTESDRERDYPTKGMSVGFTHGWELTTRLPLSIDVTGKVVWTHGIDKRLGTTRIDYLSVVFPINATYNFKPFGERIRLSPYLGPTFKFNLVGSSRPVGGRHTNYLSREEVHPSKIFQVGMNAGVGLTHKRYYIAYTFQPDIVPYRKDNNNGIAIKLRPISHSLSLGYEF